MSGPSKALESGALCRSCGACCVAPFMSDGWAGLEDEDLPALKRVRLRIVHDADLRPLIATEQREIRQGPLAGYRATVCHKLRGTPGVRASCTIYDKRPSVCREYRPGSSVCLEARKEILGK